MKALRAKTNGKAVLGLSGGVDSAVAALMLRRAGFEVTGVFMRCWDASADDRNATSGDPWCASEAGALASAEAVAKSLDMPPVVRLDLTAEYFHRVFQPMLTAFRDGVTPNPDAALCNPLVKFPALIAWARRQGADVVATGHYARVAYGADSRTPVMLRGVDRRKDQSHFLSRLTAANGSLPPSWSADHAPAASPFLAFPIGHFHKEEVRRIAREEGTPAVAACAERVSSRGLCFVETTRNGAAYERRRTNAEIPRARESFRTFLDRQLLDEMGAQPHDDDATVVVVHIDPPDLPQKHPPLDDDAAISAHRAATARFATSRVLGVLRGEAARHARTLTVGQRIPLSGLSEPIFLAGREALPDESQPTTIAYAVQRSENPALYKRRVALCKPTWLDGVGPALGASGCDVVVRFRHGKPYEGVAARISTIPGAFDAGISCEAASALGYRPCRALAALAESRFANDGIHLLLDVQYPDHMRAVAPGQVVAIYGASGDGKPGERILGGAEVAFPCAL